jgi:hypothetical protein
LNSGSSVTQRSEINFTGRVIVSDDPILSMSQVVIAPHTASTITADYSMTVWDGTLYVDTANAAGNVLVTLPDPDALPGIPAGQRYRIKDKTFNASVNNIQLTGSGGAQAIETVGTSFYSISSNGLWLDAEYDPTDYTWYLFPGIAP